MTPGTSPHPRGTPFLRWAAAERTIVGARLRLGAQRAWANGATALVALARTGALLYLALLALLVMTAWHDPAAGGIMSGMPQWHLAFLMATGTGVAVLALARSDGGAGEALDSDDPVAATAGLG